MSRVIDLTQEEDVEVEKNDKSLVLEDEEDDDLFFVEPTIIPFINYTRVPENFIPICPNATQSFQSNIEVVGKSKHRKLNHVLVSDTLASLDVSTRRMCTLNVNEVDLEREIFNSGKLYFLTKLLESIAANKDLTDMSLLILTGEAIVEKLLFRVFNEMYGYPCVRLSRSQQRFLMRANNNHAGVQCGVVIRLMSGPAKAPYIVDQNYELCALDLVEYILVFDGEALPTFLRFYNSNTFFFEEDPVVLNLCTIGTSEFRFKEYVSRSAAYKTCSMEILLNHATKEMKYRFMGRNTPFSSIDFLNWNNLIAKQVAHWMFDGSSSPDKYNFTFPLVRDEEIFSEQK